MQSSVETSNFEKFQTRNPVVRRLIDRFYAGVRQEVLKVQATSVLDAGCGEGETLDRLAAILPAAQAGVDLNAESVAFASRRIPDADIRVGDIQALPFDDGAFDLVLCLEVLEHLETPEAALAELARVAGTDIIVSVPHEPWFRAGSFARGKYLKTFGNHPEHINAWNPRSFAAFLASQTEVVSLSGAMPWLIAHCRPRG